MEGFNAENIKHWITPQRVIFGTSIAFLFGMDHVEFYDRLYQYYNNPYKGHIHNEPIKYWKDPDAGYMVCMNGDFPHCTSLTLKNYGAPTYGIESKHLVDLYTVFADKKEMIDVIKQAFKLKDL